MESDAGAPILTQCLRAPITSLTILSFVLVRRRACRHVSTSACRRESLPAAPGSLSGVVPAVEQPGARRGGGLQL
jgi:hypothetical protein